MADGLHYNPALDIVTISKGVILRIDCKEVVQFPGELKRLLRLYSKVVVAGFWLRHSAWGARRPLDPKSDPPWPPASRLWACRPSRLTASHHVQSRQGVDSPGVGQLLRLPRRLERLLC